MSCASTNRLLRIFTAKPSTTTAATAVLNPVARSDIYKSTVLRLAKVKAFPMIEEILEDQKNYKLISFEGFVIRLISLYGKAGMFDHALALFDEMPTFNCNRIVKSFSALLRAAVSAKRYDVVEELFRQFPSKYSIQLNVVSYNVVTYAFCDMGSTDLALGMLREMEELGMEPNLITFNTLLGAFYEKRGYEEGEKIWALMQTRDGVDPDVVSYKMRLKGMILGGRVMEAVELVDEMRLKGVQPDVHCFNVLIKGFCSDGKLEEAKHWYDELVKCVGTANRTTYGTLVPFLSEKGDFDMAFQLCKVALATNGRLLSDVGVLKGVVEGLFSEGMIGEAKTLVDLARKKKLEIDLPQNMW
ncbi:small ribosomal subunit protein mS79 (rPPR3b)-like [Gastrolobium bilobum]|uniref:small ribosomal subunit protein mS79 (rPPR3b)-like n=1 Tax=Gastrolobium bilobum TaxID=150636 RepID=UPI002AB2C593|nr:small ribosomal subunit protein mS79 (rPPR3b)-like [Gastrolobium bilobum]